MKTATSIKTLQWLQEEGEHSHIYYASVDNEEGEKIAEYTIKIYGAKGSLYLQHTVKEPDGWPKYGGEYLIDTNRWTLDWAMGVAERHFMDNYRYKSNETEPNG